MHSQLGSLKPNFQISFDNLFFVGLYDQRGSLVRKTYTAISIFLYCIMFYYNVSKFPTQSSNPKDPLAFSEYCILSDQQQQIKII